MVRRGPASFFLRKSGSECCWSRIALAGPALRRACRMVIRLFVSRWNDTAPSSRRACCCRCCTTLRRASRARAPLSFQRLATRSAGAVCRPSWTNLARGGHDGRGLRRRIRRDARNAPDEPCQLACDCGDDNLPQLAPRHHVTISLAQPSLCLPGNLAHRLRHGVNGGQLVAGDEGRETGSCEQPRSAGCGRGYRRSW